MNRLFRITVLINIFFISTAYSQYNPDLLSAEKKLARGDFFGVKSALQKVDTLELKLPDRALYSYLKANNFENDNEVHKALEYYLIAKKLYKQADSLEKSIDINPDIIYLIDSQDKNTTDYLKYIKEYLEYNKKNKIKTARGYGYLAIYELRNNNYKQSLSYNRRALSLIKNKGHDDMESSLNNNIANLYNERLNKPDSGLYFLEKDLLIIKKNGNNIYDLYNNYLNKASSYYHLKQYDSAITYALKADSLPIKNENLKYREAVYNALHIYYGAVKDYKKAYKYLLLQKECADSINVTWQNISIGDIDIKTKYKTLEKELENRNLREKDKINKILMYILIGLLVASFVIGILIVKNANRKEKILHQDKLIEQQKFDKALKDYELSSIDIMLEGQEKERQRIANDLHDNLGSMLATLKLNFENLKMRKKDTSEDDNKLYEKTDNLIEEAYQKVRRIAHAKNAGVYAKDGLIPAIKRLAGKISIPGKLQINVIPFGFTDRLDNTQEIAIFRIVQELATNIIKHSKATEATIHLTQHDDNMNIIIEDNGVGMDTTKISLADGMGLQGITKKTEQLNGTLTIDSTPGRGTTIILDLPI